MAGADAVGAQRGGSAARVRPHGVGQRRRPGRRGGGRARVGQPRCGLVRGRVADAPGAAPRRPRVRTGPARVGQRRADDAVLPRRRSGGAARVRPRRPPRTTAVRAAARRGGRRHGDPDRHLPRGQPRPAERARLGRRDVDRHRPRPRAARHPRPRRAGQGAPVRAHDLRGRRPRRASRHRRRVQRPDRRAAAVSRRGRVRAVRRGVGPRHAPPLLLRGRRHRALARAGGERRRPRRRRAGDRAGRSRLHPEPQRAGGGHRAGAAVPRAADARAGAGRRREPRLDPLSERAPAELLPPVDELRDRSAVRARQRRGGAERRRARPRVHDPGDARCAAGLRGRQAGGGGAHVLGGHPRQPRSDPAPGRLGGGAGQRHDRGDRVHRDTPHRHARVPGRRARPGEGGGALGGGRLGGGDVGGLPASPRSCRPPAGHGPSSGT